MMDSSHKQFQFFKHFPNHSKWSLLFIHYLSVQIQKHCVHWMKGTILFQPFSSLLYIIYSQISLSGNEFCRNDSHPDNGQTHYKKHNESGHS